MFRPGRCKRFQLPRAPKQMDEVIIPGALGPKLLQVISGILRDVVLVAVGLRSHWQKKADGKNSEQHHGAGVQIRCLKTLNLPACGRAARTDHQLLG